VLGGVEMSLAVGRVGGDVAQGQRCRDDRYRCCCRVRLHTASSAVASAAVVSQTTPSLAAQNHVVDVAITLLRTQT